MSKIGLVLEGGGMRGAYTSGITDFFLDREIYFDYVIGVSAGACNGVSYVSRQKGRNRRVSVEYPSDKHYLSLENFFKTGSLFGMDYIFEQIPNQIDPFDYKAFQKAETEFMVGVTDVTTGRPCYFGRESRKDINQIVRASCAIPVFSPIVAYRGGKYLDGGMSDPIPIRKALADGCDGAVIVLTRNRGYVKKPERFRTLRQLKYRDYPEMVRTIDRRHVVYNETLAFVAELEDRGRALVLAPEKPLEIGRFDKGKEKLQALYEEGYAEAEKNYAAIRAFRQNIAPRECLREGRQEC